MSALIWGSLLIAFAIGLSQQAPVNQEDDEKVMTIKAFNNSIGTFVEFAGRTAIAMEDWTIYASFDLKEFWREFDIIKNGYGGLEKLCAKNVEICPDFLQFKATDFENTVMVQRNLIERADPQDFKLKRLPPDSDEIADLLKAKYSVVDITANIMGNVQNRLDQLELNIDRASQPKPESWFIYHVVNQLSTLEENFKRSEDAIREALTSAHQRRLTPLILSVQQLKTEILKVQAHLPPGRRLPVDQSTVSDMYRIASVTAQQLNDTHLVFTIKVPLIDAELFSLYRLTPIPRVENGQIEVMDTEAPYLAINDHQDRYFPLENLGDCTELASEGLLCRHQQVTYGKGSFAIIPCSLAAIRNQSSAACPFRRAEKSSLWTQLLAPNSWMVALTEELSLTAVCSNDRQELTINGSGILSIRSDCIVRSSDVILQGKPTQQRTPSQMGYASLQPRINTAGYVSIQAALHQLQLRLDQLRLQDVGATPIAVIAMCPVIVVIAILLSLVWLYRYHRKRQNRGAPTPVSDAVSDIHRSQVTANVTQDGNLPLLEKSS